MPQLTLDAGLTNETFPEMGHRKDSFLESLSSRCYNHFYMLKSSFRLFYYKLPIINLPE